MTSELKKALLNTGGLRAAMSDPWVGLVADIVASCAAVARVFALTRGGRLWTQDGGQDPLEGAFVCALARNEENAISACLHAIDQERRNAPQAEFLALANSEPFLRAEMFLTQGCCGLESEGAVWAITRQIISARWALLVMAVNEANPAFLATARAAA